MILQLAVPVEPILRSLARLIGLFVFAGFLSAGVSVLYRWYVRERVPSGLALLVALAGVAVVLNTTPLLAAEIAADDEAVEIVDAMSNIVAFAGSAGAAFAGIRVGDHLAVNMNAAGGTGDVDADVSEIVQTVGRVTSVQLPEEIVDIVGYDPVPEATKETLAGRRFLFPRRLTKSELRDRLVSRLKTDYGVGHVDVEFADDGSISFLAVGSRAAGIGPTLPPATNAVAIRADPAHAASAGDLVQVWETDPMRRVVTGELRGVAGDVVTVAIDAADTPKLDPTKRYKLVTLPVQDRPDREFASLLRAADETLATVTVEAGSDLDGVRLDALPVTIAAITREDEAPEPLPARSRTLQAGDTLYAVATPELLRKLEDAATGPVGGGSNIVSSSPAQSGETPQTTDAASTPSESEPQGADASSERGNADREPAEPDDPSPEAETHSSAPSDPAGDAPDSDPDEPSTEATESHGPTDGADLDGADLGGEAFPDTADLPGVDQEAAMPDLTGESSDDTGDDGSVAADEDGSDDGGDGTAAPSDGSSGEAESVDGSSGKTDTGGGDFQALGSDGASDDGPAAADETGDFEPDDSGDDLAFGDPLGDETDDSFDDLAADDLLDAESDDPLDDGEFDDGLDDLVDEDATPEVRAEDDGDEDESVPFTPLDVGEDDPLSDPLTEGSDDGDDGDESERGN